MRLSTRPQTKQEARPTVSDLRGAMKVPVHLHQILQLQRELLQTAQQYQLSLHQPVYRTPHAQASTTIEYRTLGPVAPPVAALGKSPFPSDLELLPNAFKVSVKPFLDLGGTQGSSDADFDAAHAMLDVAELSNGNVAAPTAAH